MKVKCLHGYFIIEETTVGEIARFNSIFNVELVAKDNYFTFSGLKDAPEHALAGGTYLGMPVLKTFEGKPWEIMKENSLVYNFALEMVVVLQSVISLVTIETAGNYFVSTGLLLPGSLTKEGKRVKDYAAWFSFETMQFKYSEVSYV